MTIKSYMAPLTARTEGLYRYLSDLADAGEITPKVREMLAELRSRGFEATENKGIIAAETARLISEGLVRVHGGQQHRIFEIVATGKKTRARSRRKRDEATLAVMAALQAARLEEAKGWPEHGPREAASYDRAVRYRVFALHEMRQEARSIGRIHMPYGAVSLTGNAAEMCAAS